MIEEYLKYLNQLPRRLEVDTYCPKGIKLSKPIIYDLIIWPYKNAVIYACTKYTPTGNVLLYDNLVDFYNGELIDNIKKMIAYLKENGFIL